MRFKFDENLDVRLAPLVAEGGHDVDTVHGEGLSGRSDEAIYAACRGSGQTLITLDLNFSNPLRFPPAPTEGIIVLRPPPTSSAVDPRGAVLCPSRTPFQATERHALDCGARENPRFTTRAAKKPKLERKRNHRPAWNQTLHVNR